jgi:shikimate kinase / 3-dehydroquinate synthase
MMGAGKTTVGRGLADRLGWTYLDSDAEVEAAWGATVPEIFATNGEAAFRAAESTVLREAVSQPDPVVVSVAGGAVLDPENRALISASGTVVWLRASVRTLAKRVGQGQGRPLLGESPADALVGLVQVREPLYAELADMVIDVDELRPAQIIDRIAEEVAS